MFCDSMMFLTVNRFFGFFSLARLFFFRSQFVLVSSQTCSQYIFHRYRTGQPNRFVRFVRTGSTSVIIFLSSSHHLSGKGKLPKNMFNNFIPLLLWAELLSNSLVPAQDARRGDAADQQPDVSLGVIGKFSADSCDLARLAAAHLAVEHVNKRDKTICPAIASLGGDLSGGGNFTLSLRALDNMGLNEGTYNAGMKLMGRRSGKIEMNACPQF